MPRRGAATSTTTSPRTRSGDKSPKAAASPRVATSKDVLPSRSSPRGIKRKETETEVTDGDKTEKVTTPRRGRPKKTEPEAEAETVEETETEKETPTTKTTTRGRGRGRGRGAATSTKGRGGKRAKTAETEEAETEEPETEETTKPVTSEGEAEKGKIEKEAEEIVEEATTPSKRGRGRGRGGVTSEAEETESKEKADTAKPTTTRGRKRKTDTKSESEETGVQETTEKKSKETESVIMEKGRIYFFYRPKVETARVNDFSDIQRIYIILSPIESQPCQDPEHKHEETPSEHVDPPPPATEEGPITKQQTRHLSARFPHRLIEIPRKTLPPTTGGRARVEFAFVEKVSFCIDEIDSKLKPTEYMTKTRGLRHIGGARPVGEGIYELIKHVEVTKPGRKPTSHTQLLYTLEVPDTIGEAQRALNIRKSGSIIIQVGNPANLPSTGRTDREAPHVSHEGRPLPYHLQQLFKGIRVPQRRFIALDPPELLNYEHMQLIMVGDKHGLNEFGEIGEELIAEAEKESEKENEAHHGHPEERIQQEVHLSPKVHPMESITTGKLV